MVTEDEVTLFMQGPNPQYWQRSNRKCNRAESDKYCSLVNLRLRQPVNFLRRKRDGIQLSEVRQDAKVHSLVAQRQYLGTKEDEHDTPSQGCDATSLKRCRPSPTKYNDTEK